MPLFANQSRNQLRQTYFDAWRRHCNRQPLEPLQAQIVDVIALHPEYQALFAEGGGALQQDWLPEGGATNPFLHMGLHLAVRDQVATDRPAGIRAIFQTLAAQDSVHGAEHRIIDCLAEALWNAQRNGRPPDEAQYLDKLRSIAGTAEIP